MKPCKGFVTVTRLTCDPSQDGRRLDGHRRCEPLLHRLGSEEAQRAARDQMALNIESVVDGGMQGDGIAATMVRPRYSGVSSRGCS
jgi:hypothetical protein